MFAEFLDFFNNFGFNSGAFCPCYGLAEHVLGITMVLPGTPMIITDGRVSCGPIFDEVDVKIVDPNTLKVVANGESGEIWASSPAKSGGYWNNPEATKQNFQATIEGSSAEYLRTGDLGFIADGNLYVSGRLKDIVIIQGKNYYANDIEIAAISSQEKYLRPGSTAAFSVESNDRDAPEKLVIVLELKESYLKASPEVLADISNSIRKDVSAATGIIVSHLLLVKPKAVPKTTSGKIMRRGTKEMFLNKRLSPVFQFPVIETEASTTNYFTAFQNLLPSSLFGSTPVSAAPKSHLQDPVQLRVAKVWSKVLQIPLESITSDSDFYALGGTSISTIAVINSLTQEDAGFRGMTFQMFMLNSNLESMANLWLDPSVERASTNDNEEDEETPEVLNKAVEAYEKELEELDDVSISSDGCLEFNASKIAESHNAVVLLTGANGFLGSGIVFSFMKQFPTIRLICQVRAKSKEHGVQRIKEL
ncbi:acetyl-CoA synthetase-like protein [Rhizoclosmatium globosum]|uniref:Acetyl-CoA synthetase-like protein n=1 Tax=Rhizoclosmatium globosum TaxID=329046 RepID=A0A1Y2CED6_9FUNG|nr:acetyl-CoA synthetase-like protein [Rhizoclosmatium globosum]|eukprot:ORY45174.1 acetyl-CoA synthetase-like protein [Rhizoclosmatium globosum]